MAAGWQQHLFQDLHLYIVFAHLIRRYTYNYIEVNMCYIIEKKTIQYTVNLFLYLSFVDYQLLQVTPIITSSLRMSTGIQYVILYKKYQVYTIVGFKNTIILAFT
ncbi:hypothetical protein ACJX0J_016077 [Zea mays]